MVYEQYKPLLAYQLRSPQLHQGGISSLTLPGLTQGLQGSSLAGRDTVAATANATTLLVVGPALSSTRQNQRDAVILDRYKAVILASPIFKIVLSIDR